MLLFSALANKAQTTCSLYTMCDLRVLIWEKLIKETKMIDLALALIVKIGKLNFF